MSDFEDGEEEEEKSEITPTPFVWEQIHHFHSNTDPWSLIHRNDVVPPAQTHLPDVVFPPVNHEDLDVREVELDRRATTPTTPRRSSADGEPVLRPRWNVIFRILGLKFSGIVSLVCNFVANRGGVMRMCFSSGFAVAALLWYYLRLRRVRREESVSQLIRVIKEKDEKIHQLLYQIARMNELLLASHHGVPISGTASSSNHGKF